MATSRSSLTSHKLRKSNEKRTLYPLIGVEKGQELPQSGYMSLSEPIAVAQGMECAG